ncbi:MAG: LLM class flavin-dependent oxidoreductase [bacterium]|nr:LLM class flavin-dependent oxidoreductase [bacterium]
MAFSMLRFVLSAPPGGEPGHREIYEAALEMAEFAEEKGFGMVVLSEHHCTEGGFMPSPLVMAAAIAGRTRRIALMVSALLAPLYDPIRLAEDVSVLDLISAGRASFVLGMGYRPIEYTATNKEFRRRGKLLDQVIETLLKAWSGEPFEYNGETIQVTPKPFTQPHPRIIVGGSTPAGARRAARFGLPFGPPISDAELNQVYIDECKRLGVESPVVVDPREPFSLYVAEDPDEGWKQIGPHWLREALSYASWQVPGQRSYQHSHATNIEELRAEGKFRVWTPEQCLAWVEEHGQSAWFSHFPLGGGAPPAVGWKSLELFAEKVVPYL